MKKSKKQKKNYDWDKGFLSGVLAIILIWAASNLFSITLRDTISSNLKILAVVGGIIFLIYSARLFIKYFKRV